MTAILLRTVGARSQQMSEQVGQVCCVSGWVEFLYGPLAENPHRVGAPLRKPFEGHRRARRGEYRVRYTIDDARMEIAVLDINHRRDAYR
jgi:mRNA interferase RelE/StbE